MANPFVTTAAVFAAKWLVGKLFGRRPRRFRNVSEFSAASIVTNRALSTVTSVDDASGTITGSADGEINKWVDACAHLIAAFGSGITNADLEFTSNAFGAWDRTTTAVGAWDVGGNDYRINAAIDAQTSIGAAVDRFCKQAPMSVHRNPSDGTVYAFPYWETAPALAQSTTGYFRYFGSQTSINTFIKFHPNIEGEADYGKPYALRDFHASLTPIEDIYNRFKILYRYDRSTGQYRGKQILTETAADSNIATDNGDNTVLPNAAVATSAVTGYGYDMSSVCQQSQNHYGITREMVVELPDVYWHTSASAYLNYLLRRHTGQRIIVGGVTGLETLDLLPGHVIRFSNDCNRVFPRPDYLRDPATRAGWSDIDFLTQTVSVDLDNRVVGFAAEQIVYDPEMD